MSNRPWNNRHARERIPYGHGRITITMTQSRRFRTSDETLEIKYAIDIAYVATGVHTQGHFGFEKDLSEVEEAIRKWLSDRLGITLYADNIIETVIGLKNQTETAFEPKPVVPQKTSTMVISGEIQKHRRVDSKTVKTFSSEAKKDKLIRITLGEVRATQSTTTVKVKSRHTSTKMLSVRFYIEVTQVTFGRDLPVGVYFEASFVQGIYKIEHSLRLWLKKVKKLDKASIEIVVAECKSLQTSLANKFDRKPGPSDKKWRPR